MNPIRRLAMNRTWMTRGLALTTLASLSGLIAAAASCATNDPLPEDALKPDAATLPEASAPAHTDEVDATADAEIVDAGSGCDAADRACNTHVVTCDEVEWCGVETGVNPLYILKNVWGSSKNDVWAVGSGGTIAHYDGATWKVIPTGLQQTFVSVWGSGPNDVYAIANTEFFFHSNGIQEDGGADWTRVTTSLVGAYATPAYAVWGTSPVDVRVGHRSQNYPGISGSYQMLLRKDLADGGVGWLPATGAPFQTRGFWASSPSDVWMIGDNSTAVAAERAKIMHGVPAANPADAAVDAGVDSLVWTPVDSQASLTLDSIWGSGPNDVWTVGAGGTIRHFTPNDTRWQPVLSGTIANLHGVWGSGPNDIWIVGDAGTILHWDGTSLRNASAQFALGRKPNLYGIWGSGPNDVWIVGDAITLHYTGPKAGAQGDGQ